MRSVITVLHVDSNRRFREFVASGLAEASGQFDVQTADSVSEALGQLDDEQIDCVLSGNDLPDGSGLDLLTAVRDRYSDLPFVLCPEEGSEAIASEAIASGVTDYVRRETADDAEALGQRLEDSVTQYRETRQAERMKRQLKQLVTSTTDCFWMFDASWEEALFISGYEEVWNRPAERIRQNPQDFLEGTHPEDREFVEQEMERLSDGDEIDIEYRIAKGDGETGWVWVKGQPIVENGTVVRVAGFTRDISERRTRKEELELRTQAMNEAPVGVVMTDPSREDNPLTYLNEQFLEMTGYTREEALGRNCRFLQGEETDEEPVATLREAIDAKEPVTVELRNYRKDGTRFWNRVSVAPVFGDDGEVCNYIGFQEDVTDRKQRQHQLEVLDRVLRHNLRNRTTVIRSRTEELQAGEHADGSEHTEAIVQECEKLLNIAEKERLITRTLSNPYRTTVQARPMLSGAVAKVQDDNPEAAISVECRDDPAIDVSPLIEEAFGELLLNALRHSVESSPEVSVSVTAGDDVVCIEVEDTGPPIPEMERALLQGHEKSPLEHGGGLGLWFVNLVVTQSNGSIDIKENDRGGNTIRVILPRKPP